MSFHLEKSDEIKSIKFTPSKYLVVKSKLISNDQKIFINIVHHDKYPFPPDIKFDPSIVYPLIINNQWEIPIITTSYVESTDKKGHPCLVWDCCINSECEKWCAANDQLKDILIEWCIESCELRSSLEIDRDDLKFPKLKYKGDIVREIELLEEDIVNIDKSSKNDGNNTDKDNKTLATAKDSTVEFLELKRQYEGGNVDNGDDVLPELLLPNQHPHKNASVDKSDMKNDISASNKPPLIQELDSTEKDLMLKKNFLVKGKQQKQKSQEISLFRYSVKMGKPSKPTAPYKLKIEITTNMQNVTSLDFTVNYADYTNTVTVKNTNTHRYKEKSLDIPLPSLYKSSSDYVDNFKVFFLKKSQTLYIFI
ncbi:uncharacterized protein SCODWIG_02015 [Saccharomycodes ludwigii]|uniref:Protein interacting with Hsp90 1 n=1 Tax=Saccharomycodes ludwigii TaxID=36035 RepID=A0A376B6Z9_9ASCO|nr:uncharacterized protein SCODWIG_02015 [Saccharomycodes ludwigii]